MKKLISILLVLVCALSLIGSAFAEGAETTETTEAVETESQFEKVLLKKGSLILKEFIDYGKVSNLELQSACLTDLETGSKYYALRITTSYYNSKYDYGDAVGILDSAEIDGAISTLEYIKAHFKELKDYSEVVYKANSGMEIGAYHSSDDNKVYIKVNSKATKFYELDLIDDLIAGFKGVKAMFDE